MSRSIQAASISTDKDVDEQKTIALEHILDAWDDALSSGCSSESIATSAIFAALSDMIDLYGEEIVADMAAALPDRIRRGEFSMRDATTN
ncbi:MAG: hypothetical protein PVI23_08430 [Maricaulaceae bacterium]|jgi:hypothetical protein